MAEVLLPDQLGTMLADFDRRLRDMENTPRVGLDRIRTAWGTAAADPTVFGVTEYGPVGSTWADDKGVTGTGYPTITMYCPTKVQLTWSARPINVATAAGFRSQQVTMGIAIDGVAVLQLPSPRRAFSNANGATVDAPCTATVVKSVIPGVHTFAMWALWVDSNPAALTLPRLTDVFMSILPLTAS